MKNYICLTNQGFTESPTNIEVENQQILGYAVGNSRVEAVANLLKDNPEILDVGFNKSEIIVKELKSA